MYFSATNLYKAWDSIKISLSFECEQGTMTSIVGPSGSGKSTVLRIIAGLESCSSSSPATQSKIILDGKDISRLPPAKRGIGMVFQSHSLFAHMTVEDNVAYGLRCHGVPKKQSREQARAFLSKFNLSGFGKRLPDTLSGGEAQRVSLARTLIIKPALVLFDEPLSALDAPLRRRLADEIRALQSQTGFTAIMVTHDLSEAKRISDKILLIKNGSLTWQGTPDHFKDDLL